MHSNVDAIYILYYIIYTQSCVVGKFAWSSHAESCQNNKNFLNFAINM